MDRHSYTGKLLNHSGEAIDKIDTTKLPLVEIFWEDAWGDDAHLEIEACEHLVEARRKHAGYLASYDENRIVLANGMIINLFHDKTFAAGVETIPWPMIKVLRLVDAPELDLWK